MMRAFFNLPFAVVAAILLFSLVLLLASDTAAEDGDGDGDGNGDGNGSVKSRVMGMGYITLSASHRKLLHRALVEPNRIWGEKCSKADIVINQGPTSPLPSGIPTYTVEIMNVCVTGCDISGIHLSCGWFSSARLINPRIFKRLRYDDCLVNDGRPLTNGGTLSFQYANTFPYPLSVFSVVC